MDPVQRHFPSLLMNVTFLLFFVAQLSRAKGCRRTQPTNGRMRLATESANEVNSLHLARWPQGLESHKKLCALWRHLCDEALRRLSTGPSDRQGTEAALAALLKEMSDCSVSTPPHTCDAVGSPGRRYLEEEHQRMRRYPLRNRGGRVASGLQ